MSTGSDQLKEENVLIQECINGNRKSQYELYDFYARKMYAICLRYAKNSLDAQDILQNGFIRVFKSLVNFKGEGSFNGWIRKIFVNSCIEFLRNGQTPITYDTSTALLIEDKELNGFDKISMNELLGIIQSLPEGYRIVVNLFMVEGFSHREIGSMLGISEVTSRSQLTRAKASLQKKIQVLSN